MRCGLGDTTGLCATVGCVGEGAERGQGHGGVVLAMGDWCSQWLWLLGDGRWMQVCREKVRGSNNLRRR